MRLRQIHISVSSPIKIQGTQECLRELGPVGVAWADVVAAAARASVLTGIVLKLMVKTIVIEMLTERSAPDLPPTLRKHHLFCECPRCYNPRMKILKG